MGSGPTSSAPESGKSKKAIAIVIAVVAIIAVIGIAVTAIVLSADKETAPEKVFKNYVDAGVNHDAGGMYNTTIWGLNQSLYTAWYNWIEWRDITSIEIRSLNTTYRADMTQEQKEEMDLNAQTIEDLMNVSVEEVCFVGFNTTVTITNDGHSETDNSTGEVPFVKIDGKWYIVMMLDDLENILRPPVQPPYASLAKATITSGEKITIVSITRVDVPWGDVNILLVDGASGAVWSPVTDDLDDGPYDTMNYSDNPLGAIDVCCSVTDLAGNGVLNAGDYFTLVTYGGASTFEPGVTYTALLVYQPTGDQMASIMFIG